MKAYILPSGRMLSPFLEPVGTAARVLNESLVQRQVNILSGLGLEPVHAESVSQISEGEHLVVTDQVFYTKGF